jgi:hypothetical protein
MGLPSAAGARPAMTKIVTLRNVTTKSGTTKSGTTKSGTTNAEIDADPILCRRARPRKTIRTLSVVSS